MTAFRVRGRQRPNFGKLHKYRKNFSKSLCILHNKIFPKTLDNLGKLWYNNYIIKKEMRYTPNEEYRHCETN